MRRSLAGALLIAALASCGPNTDRGAATSSATSSATPLARRTTKITVALVVDQLALWHVLERFPLLPSKGGFARLFREASALAELRYGYVQTSTAMGHSSLFSGLSPHDSGITSNDVFDADGRGRSVVSDDDVRVLTSQGAIDRASGSLHRFASDRLTFADSLRAQRPDVTIACLSMKDRGALFACGRSPDVVLWFDTKENAFVTSTAFAKEFPAAYAGALGVKGAGATYQSKSWKAEDDAWLAARVTKANRDVGQADFEGMGKFMPHAFDPTKNVPRAMLATPMADEMLTDLALSTIDALPADKDAYLAISFSAYDYVHHIFGAETEQSWDVLHRLDGQLARLFDRLDERYGPSGWSMVLSGDHGGPPGPEGAVGSHCGNAEPDRFERSCIEQPVRVREEDVQATAVAAAERVLGEGRWVLGCAEPFVVFSKKARQLPTADRDRLVGAVRDAVLAMPGVAEVRDTRAGAAVCPPYEDDSLEALLCRSMAGPTRGDLLVLMDRGAFFEPGFSDGDGCNHGTRQLFDRTVPIVVRRARPDALLDGEVPKPAFDPKERVDLRAYSRTLAGLLGIEPLPSSRDGRDLSR